ncbi:beta-N-acetylhexosaminidase [Microbacterium awajiense]|uniref:beta-N-acetylhexosaminidase n=2 Tax=Microbacterium awajiense TaxID=415214 RepID=A0ABP7AG32_9MICO
MTVAVVPAPSTIRDVGTAPFRLAGAGIVGDADAASALRTLLSALTGSSPGGDERTIDLQIEHGGAPESYTLVADETSVVVTGADAAGLFYGVHTLAQLARESTDGWVIDAVEVEDAPRFRYRGVMLDVARHFHPVATVEAFIDRAAMLKFNHLHLHLTDDQGWRVHLDARPELTRQGSGTSVGGDPGGFYTKDDYRHLVAYAAARHVTVVPEIDMPGHTHAVGLAYPELVEAPVLSEHILETVAEFGGDAPAAGVAYDGMAVGFSSLRIGDERAYDFVADVFGELASMTPGPYLHVGGDEALGTDPADFAAFVARATEIIADLGKTPIAWHEAGAAPDLAPGTVGQYWGFVTPTDGMDDAARAFVRNGAPLILSPADAVYLDMKQTADSPLGLTWARGITDARRAYTWEPTAVIDGIGEDDILGVEAPLWTETVRSLADIDELAFPRIAAAAEAAWSPPVGTSALRTWESFRERVGRQAPLWRAQGIGFHRSEDIPWR